MLCQSRSAREHPRSTTVFVPTSITKQLEESVAKVFSKLREIEETTRTMEDTKLFQDLHEVLTLILGERCSCFVVSATIADRSFFCFMKGTFFTLSFYAYPR